MIRVTVWGENVHEQTHEAVRAIYPDGMHRVIADALAAHPDISARTATLQEPQHGLPGEVLEQTDVLTWWGHCAHDQVEDAIVDRVQTRVLEGMGIIVLHSGHFSKVFKRLMGTSCALKWREAGERERVWCCNPGHPIARGLPPYFELEQAEMYGEPFGIPTPDDIVFISWFEGGEVFRSGCTWRRGAGKVFYFSPGHETYPTYHDANVMQVIANAVRWAAPAGERWENPRAGINTPVEQAPEPIVTRGESVH